MSLLARSQVRSDVYGSAPHSQTPTSSTNAPTLLPRPVVRSFLTSLTGQSHVIALVGPATTAKHKTFASAPASSSSSSLHRGATRSYVPLEDLVATPSAIPFRIVVKLLVRRSDN